MQHAELAALLVSSCNASRETLLWENSTLADVELGYRLKDICLEGWSTHPAQALGAAASLQLRTPLLTSPTRVRSQHRIQRRHDRRGNAETLAAAHDGSLQRFHFDPFSLREIDQE